MRYLEIAARLSLGVVFVVALAGKVGSAAAVRAFTDSLRQMAVLPETAVPAAARLSIAVEALVVVLLAMPLRWSGAAGLALAAATLVALSTAIGLSLRRGNRAPCRCFGASSTPLGRGHIVRNLTLAALALAGLAAALASGSASLPGGLLAGVAGLVAGALVTSGEDLVALVKPLR